MSRAGRPRTPGLPRTKSGRGSRRRADLINAGQMVHTDYAVYFAKVGELVKIGYSGSLALRMYQLGYEAQQEARMIGIVLVPSEALALKLERKLQANFASKLVKGREWFDLSRGDVLATLADCRHLGLRTLGGDDASNDQGLLSGTAYVSDQDDVKLLRV